MSVDVSVSVTVCESECELVCVWVPMVLSSHDWGLRCTGPELLWDLRALAHDIQRGGFETKALFKDATTQRRESPL